MRAEDLLLLAAYGVHWITLLLLVKRSEHKKRLIAINMIPQLAYSALLQYQIAYHSSGGSGFIWWFYLLFLIGLHWGINLTQLLKIVLSKRK